MRVGMMSVNKALDGTILLRISIVIVLLASVSLVRSSVFPQTEDHVAPFSRKGSFYKISKQKLSLNNIDDRPIEKPLLIGSFNIQTLVKRKFKNPDVMYVVEQVILRYDLILIMEVMTATDNYMHTLLEDVNSEVPPEEAYGMILSDRQIDTKEHYAFFYKKSKLKLITIESYDDPAVFYRKPLIAIFEAFTLRDMKKFGAVGHHVKPAEAVREINGLADIYDYINRKYEMEDVLLMGDFNADCAYVKENDWDRIALWYRSEFTWAITNKMDTTTNYKSCALDRFVYAGENMNDGVILSSAGIFDFGEEYMLSNYEIRNISDHWPIELKIRGKMSEFAEKHLTSDICFHVQDSQQRTNITENIAQLAKKSFFDATKTAGGILLTNKTRDEEGMLNAMKKIRLDLPNVVTHEIEEAVRYKVRHGTLKDDSSYADLRDFRYVITIYTTKEFVVASICRTTSIN